MLITEYGKTKDGLQRRARVNAGEVPGVGKPATA